MRVVVGLILEQGLIRAESEAELNSKAIAAYRDFRRRNFHTFWRFPEAIARWLRGLVVRNDYSRDETSTGLRSGSSAYGTPLPPTARRSRR